MDSVRKTLWHLSQVPEKKKKNRHDTSNTFKLDITVRMAIDFICKRQGLD